MINSEILKIRDKLIEALHPLKIYLFGSFAKDTYREDSDYDFCIIVADDEKEKIFDLTGKAYHYAGYLSERSTDFFVVRESRFNERAPFSTIEREIKNDGIVLYEQ